MKKFIIVFCFLFSFTCLAALEASQDENGNIFITLTNDETNEQKVFLVTEVVQLADNQRNPIRLQRVLAFAAPIPVSPMVPYDPPIEGIIRGVIRLFTEQVYNQLLRLLGH